MSLVRNWKSLIAIGSCTALAALAVSCAREQESPVQGQQQPTKGTAQQIPSKGLEEAKRIASQGQVYCSEPDECPGGVGMLVATQDSGVSVCTGFLVTPDLVATSGHCIPDDLKAQRSACHGRMRMLFPAVGNLASSDSECAEVLFASQVKESETDNRLSDYAFVKLEKPVVRQRFVVSADGLSNGMEVTIPKMDPISDVHPIGEIRSVHCKVIQKSAVLPQFQSDASPVASLGDCNIVHGNSGSPVLDSNGAVRALIHGSFDHRESYQLALQNVLHEPMSDFAFATSFACIQEPEDGSKPRALPASCASDAAIATEGTKDPSGIAITAEDNLRARQDLDKAFNDWNGAHADRIRWKEQTKSSNFEADVLPVPDCFNQPEKWVEIYHRPWYEFGGYKNKASFDIERTEWQLTFEVNSYLQVVHHLKPVRTVKARITFSPKELHENHGSGRVVVEPQLNDGDAPQEGYDAVIKRCQ